MTCLFRVRYTSSVSYQGSQNGKDEPQEADESETQAGPKAETFWSSILREVVNWE
jgi:hypothetical protein